ncbi:PBP superfamily domain-containing protein [Haloechinothrix alba]|uniref:PBP superfamily domain-containing protein n=1 Tax=Haloechinothrix alba TaxID=664784 RepID=A0A238YQX8_9PSEU|nr:substrate-binding domain-containing protein [Haloechinothrix alba]SNR73054.1 PBP superfamily domain-containing protein [Haloechinothrix alba]
MRRYLYAHHSNNCILYSLHTWYRSSRTPSRATPRPQGDLADSHIGVAVAVSSGAADAGLAVRAAATAVDTDFVPVGHEDFELAVNPDATAALAPLLDVLATRSFRKRLSMMAGYDFCRTGAFREAT